MREWRTHTLAVWLRWETACWVSELFHPRHHCNSHAPTRGSRTSARSRPSRIRSWWRYEGQTMKPAACLLSVNQPEHNQDYPEAEVDELRFLEEEDVTVGPGRSQKAVVNPHLWAGQLVAVIPSNCCNWYKNMWDEETAATNQPVRWSTTAVMEQMMKGARREMAR